jgi:hypothetical protein
VELPIMIDPCKDWIIHNNCPFIKVINRTVIIITIFKKKNK